MGIVVAVGVLKGKRKRWRVVGGGLRGREGSWLGGLIRDSDLGFGGMGNRMVVLDLEVSWVLEVMRVASFALMKMGPSSRMKAQVCLAMGMECGDGWWRILRAGDLVRLWKSGTTF